MPNELQPATINDAFSQPGSLPEKVGNFEPKPELPQIIKTTRIISWSVLVCGIIGALTIYNTIGSEKIRSNFNYESATIYNPYGIILAVGVLAVSIIMYTVLSILAINCENLFHIRYSLNKKENSFN